MDSFADRPQCPGPHRGSFPAGKGLVWIAGAILSGIAAALAAVLAIALAASVVVVAVIGGVVLFLATLALRARRPVRVRSNAATPQIIEARNVGGHSWVAYGWDHGQ